ncbi:DNA-binding NarL/FixJ family response regulator [Rhizobium sp. BK313]|uniref:response regulator n=1 Tax=Rhizobium sp. BK313 TaxID=2587081 RepID=UPI00105D5FA9|nr:response regulator transcription factor [Rhizobium sp. BK313]MBB3458981.1 DNA-binding NarL/FixJ family response regulator [Rhizobium sp. BK313]
MGKAASLILVDDHALFRKGVLQALADHGEIEVVGEGASKEETISLVATLAPSIALLDISMPGNGIAAAREIHARWPAVKIVMLTVSEDEDDVLQALEAGAVGYILKGIAAPDLIAALAAIGRNETYLDPKAGALLFNAMKSQSQQRDTPQQFGMLSPREQQIFRLLGEGSSNKHIAESTGIQLRTVKFHVSNILMKMNARNRVEIALAAQKLLGKQS